MKLFKNLKIRIKVFFLNRKADKTLKYKAIKHPITGDLIIIKNKIVQRAEGSKPMPSPEEQMALAARGREPQEYTEGQLMAAPVRMILNALKEELEKESTGSKQP